MPVSSIETPKQAKSAKTPGLDERLVRECLAGDQRAWSELVDRYKNLIFSIPLRYGFSREDAADIFQEVCVGMLSQLATVRDPQALPKWLMQVTAHKCYRLKQRSNRVRLVDLESEEEAPFELPPDVLEIVQHVEQEQLVREAMTQMSPRCRSLITLLFFEDPPRPYAEVAAELGIAIGSIGLLRHRCIERMRKTLSEIGVGSFEQV